MVLDFHLSPKLACLHDRALRSDFEVGGTTFEEIFFQNYRNNIPKKGCDLGFEEIEKDCLHVFVGCFCICLRT